MGFFRFDGVRVGFDVSVAGAPVVVLPGRKRDAPLRVGRREAVAGLTRLRRLAAAVGWLVGAALLARGVVLELLLVTGAEASPPR